MSQPIIGSRIVSRAIRSGTVACVTSVVALAIAARRQGLHPVQPLNATSHWLNGQDAGDVARVDLRHTGTGLLTHHAATIFWALLFEWLNRGAARPGRGEAVRLAVATSVIAAGTDYLATPWRFTPGWELVLPKRSMAAVYGAMAAGLAVAARTRADTRLDPG
ncbi:hypothetical protein [Rhizosaccharibacter radicis]|uniref:DUF2938 family protein n=1 Tax=Rhizosaccharibacter radicis TaxID=2782605 RepID=A0ABT1VTZ1_9PROT|nr:hypothetical protein [Acetobacteraceae bacterium KSS12]